ncbi:hypothetical protein C8F01DRAFT_1048029 [Mycena amicta]|nr:hypothetical protein C8F01DRAFT_1048029 [Mycena amicta]
MVVPNSSEPFTSSRFILDMTLSTTFLSDIRRISREESIPPVHLSSSLDDLSADLARYDEEITRLTFDRQMLQYLHDTGRSLFKFTPIRRLPVEILTDIFRRIWIDFQLAYLAGDPWDTSAADRCSSELLLAAAAPLLDVSGVCGRWRAIVMSTPALWTDIWVGKDHERDSKTLPIAKGLLQLALQRSRDLPLHIRVLNHLEYGADRNKSLLDNEALNLLSEESSRWKAVEFDCLQEDILNCDVEHRMPLLEHLDVSYLRGEVSRNILDRFRDCHRLKTVSFRAEIIDASRLPLEQLFLVRINHTPVDQIPTAMHYLARLSTSAWLGISVRDGETLRLPATTSNVTALVLRSLSQPKYSVHLLVDILSSLTLPRLDTLTLEHDIYPKRPTGLYTALMGMAQRSDFGAHLRTLNLRRASLDTDTELLGVLSAVHSLEILMLGDGYPKPDPDDADSSSSDDDEPPQQPLLSQMLLSRLSHCLSAGSESESGLDTDTFELVPRLRIFTYAWDLNLQDNVGAFLEFIYARANVPRKEPFTVHLQQRIGDRSYQTDLEFELERSSELQRLTGERKLRYTYRESDISEWLLWRDENGIE